MSFVRHCVRAYPVTENGQQELGHDDEPVGLEFALVVQRDTSLDNERSSCQCTNLLQGFDVVSPKRVADSYQQLSNLVVGCRKGTLPPATAVIT